MVFHKNFKINCALLIFLFYYVQLGATLGSDIDIALSVVRPESSEIEQRKAVERIIRRLIPDRANEFVVRVESFNAFLEESDKDEFKVVKRKDGKIQVTGTTGVAAAYGFHHYLKYYCKNHVSWEVMQLDLPKELPAVNIHIKSMDRIRYYMNVCTLTYSYLWWNWKDWDRHIDWIALNGFNLVLAPMAQEAIWYRVYSRMNLTDDDINDYFTGPAMIPWNRMGNVHGWGGPLSAHWHERSLFLQKNLLRRYRQIGITPVLSAFNGYVPPAIAEVFKESQVKRFGAFSFFIERYGYSYFVDPSDPLFQKLGNAYIKEQMREFGTGHVYISDPYNEILPPTESLSALSDLSKAIYSAIATVDPMAIWMIQSWGFTFHKKYWTDSRVKAYLQGPPLGRILVLDTVAEHFPEYQRFESFYGQPFIWCLLHNFGGSPSMYGNLERINKEAHVGRTYKNSTMVGLGVSPEGINQNYVIYDLMIESAWRNESVDLEKWLNDYATRRYGKPNIHAFKAWQILNETVYSYNTSRTTKVLYAITRPPRLDLGMRIWYNGTRVAEAWDQMILAIDDLGNNECFRYDLIDVTKQVLLNQFDVYFLEMRTAVFAKNLKRYEKISSLLYEMLLDFDRLLLTDKHFLIGPYIEAARAAANSTADRRLFEYNAKNIVTLWGPRGEIKDYSYRHWAGLFSDYYNPRWKIFFETFRTSLIEKIAIDERELNRQYVEQVEKPFVRNTKNYTTEPIGDTIAVTKEIYQKYRNKVDNFSIFANDMEAWLDYLLLKYIPGKPNVEYIDKILHEQKF